MGDVLGEAASPSPPQEGESNTLECQQRDVKTAEAQQDSCPRHSAAVIVRNKWWPRDDFHDAC